MTANLYELEKHFGVKINVSIYVEPGQTGILWEASFTKDNQRLATDATDKAETASELGNNPTTAVARLCDKVQGRTYNCGFCAAAPYGSGSVTFPDKIEYER